jgi:predicted HicB family RNase H-like nuclease
MMVYKEYTAGPIEFDAEDNTFSGTVAGLRDVVHFEGSTMDELMQAFRESVDMYVALRAESKS